ncbi:hypothetical protein MO867_22365 [Microbulbifer sp. OS29]|uniref:Uncharacterized protein n=1 Tax=Microbulbifer okhotskensis TaxID=2926617 RepID=A0A9X2EWA6_9GAMM|nr:hypothetical protein [Microbulbifer okhotskensis]MCO1337071.1 hypothetical protein [Microbulbifer okhotskensis]
MINIKMSGLGVLALSSVLVGCSIASDNAAMSDGVAGNNSAMLYDLAEQSSEVFLENFQPHAYFMDMQPERHNLFLSNSPESVVSMAVSEDKILEALAEIDPKSLKSDQERVFYFKLRERLESNVGLRICKTELWSVDHMFGPHILLGFLSEVQPVETAENKADAMERWLDAASYYEQKIVNLMLGLESGLSHINQLKS